MKAAYVSPTTCLVLLLTALVLCTTTSAYARGPESTYPVQVDSGWNLLSLPADVSNGDIGVLFPSAVSAAFTFRDPLGYEEQDTVHSGVGFWLKFNSSETVPTTGELIFEDTVEVHAGWNIVGSLSVPIAADSIKTEPPGMITSVFFGFRSGVGYEEADTLYPGYGYWVKVNRVGSMVLSSGSGQPCPGIPTVSYGGKVYSTVLIGTQCWLRENLDIGIMLQSVAGQGNNQAIEKYCYSDDSANCQTYGGLYQWREAMQYIETPGTRGICPPGWHIPMHEEYLALRGTVGSDGNALKAVGQGSGAGAGTNISGFSALLGGGWRVMSEDFDGLGEYSRFWISYIDDEYGEAGHFYISGQSSDVGHFIWENTAGMSVRCIRDNVVGQAPTPPSDPYPENGTDSVFTSVILQWSCDDPDGDPVNCDVYLGVHNPPDTIVAHGTPNSSLALTGLQEGATYYWKVVAYDNHGNSATGSVWTFATTGQAGEACPGTPTVTYRGRTYTTVLIGSQCWLRENLDAGIMINATLNQTDNDSLEKYCYDNIPANCDTFGGLYEWGEVTQYVGPPGRQGICPPGWHVPTIEEFGALAGNVGMDGNALVAVGQGAGGGTGTNTSGFTGLFAGFRSEMSPGSFGYLGWKGYFWSSTPIDAVGSWYMMLRVGSGLIGILGNHRDHGFSVRCLKD